MDFCISYMYMYALIKYHSKAFLIRQRLYQKSLYWLCSMVGEIFLSWTSSNALQVKFKSRHKVEAHKREQNGRNPSLLSVGPAKCLLRSLCFSQNQESRTLFLHFVFFYFTAFVGYPEFWLPHLRSVGSLKHFGLIHSALLKFHSHFGCGGDVPSTKLYIYELRTSSVIFFKLKICFYL